MLSAYAQNKVLDALLRGAALALPGVYYVALVTTTGATNALAGQEVSGGAYARAAVALSLSSWSATQGGTTGTSTGIGGISSNAAPIVFPQPTDNWGSVVGYELWDAATFGNRWIYDVLRVPKTISAGDPAATFPIGELQLSII
jgi:hypothetical protein